jgi:hypothetical protein
MWQFCVLNTGEKQNTFFGVYYDILNVDLDVKGLHHVVVLYTKY